MRLCFLLWGLRAGLAWNRWEYSPQWSALSPEGALAIEQEWFSIWGAPTAGSNDPPAPRPRRGHSLVLYQSPNAYPYFGDTYIVMFGGRDNDENTTHVPKTYDLESINGTLQFTTYDQKPVNPCSDVNGTYYTAEERSACSNSSDPNIIPVGVYYNDVWAYKLCNKYGCCLISFVTSHYFRSTPPYRYFNGPCVNNSWVLWNPGAHQGGCEYKLNILVCTTPSERYNHGAVVFEDGAMFVYGGYGQRCADYCDDLWMFDLSLRVWRQIYDAGALSRLRFEVLPDGTTVPYSQSEVPVDSGGWAGPGKRWRHSQVAGPTFVDGKGVLKQNMAVFGGHRLWQGFSPENSLYNDWSNFTTRPLGGYLSDLWVYTRLIDNTTDKGVELITYEGFWEELEPKEQCYPDPGITWSSRNDTACTFVWPDARAGHGKNPSFR